MNRTRRGSAQKSTVADLAWLLARIRSGNSAPEDRDFAKRCLAKYRAKYRAGSLSDRTARRLGLIDAEGKERS
jgi:hypothetical protein